MTQKWKKQENAARLRHISLIPPTPKRLPFSTTFAIELLCKVRTKVRCCCLFPSRKEAAFPLFSTETKKKFMAEKNRYTTQVGVATNVQLRNYCSTKGCHDKAEVVVFFSSFLFYTFVKISFSRNVSFHITGKIVVIVSICLSHWLWCSEPTTWHSRVNVLRRIEFMGVYVWMGGRVADWNREITVSDVVICYQSFGWIS